MRKYLGIVGILFFLELISLTVSIKNCFHKNMSSYMGSSFFNSKEPLKFEELYHQAFQKLLLMNKDYKKCKNDIFSPSCDFIFYNEKKNEFEELYELIDTTETGKGLNQDLSILFQKVLANKNDSINLFNSLYSKLVSLYPNTLTLISSNFAISSVFLTSKFLNIIHEMKNGNFFKNSTENEKAKLEEDIHKMVQFLLDNIYSVTKIEELLHLSRFIYTQAQNLFFFDWGTRNATIMLNNTASGEKTFHGSVKNGVCKKVPLKDTEIYYNTTAFMLIRQNDRASFSSIEQNFGEYIFEAESDEYNIHSSKKVVSFTRTGITEVNIEVKNADLTTEQTKYKITRDKQSTLNLSLVTGDVAVFDFSIVNNFGEVDKNECHFSLLMNNIISFKERVVLKRKIDNLTIDLSDLYFNDFPNGNYSAMLLEDCPFTRQKSHFFLGFISFYRENNKAVDKIYEEYFDTKPLLEHTFQPPMVVANEWVSMCCIAIPLLFGIIFKQHFDLNQFSLIEFKEAFAHIYYILFFCCIYLLSGLLIYYWTMLNLFEMLFYLAFALPVASIITLKFLQNLDFTWPEEKELIQPDSSPKGKEKDKDKSSKKQKKK